MTPADAAYPLWVEQFRQSYDRRESAFFVLHTNIDDVFPLGAEYVSCTAYLQHLLEKGDYIVIYYDVSRGMRFSSDQDARRFVELANQNLPGGQRLIRSIYDFPKESTQALAFIEAFIVGIESSDRPVAVLLEYGQHLAPNGDPQTMSEVDRINSVTLQRFAHLFHERLQDTKLRDAVCFVLAPNLHSLHPDLVRSELVTAVEVPRPDLAERERFIRWQQAKLVVEGREPLTFDVSEAELAEQTAGLTLTGIRHLFLRACHSNERRLTQLFVTERKRELIIRDSRGMLEILAVRHGLDAVGGNVSIKQFFVDTARDLREGRHDVPVGVVCPGPNGVGKTFIAKAFARDAGVTAVSLRNFRGMYVGQTESNLDTIFSILKAMTPNIVLIDEADKTLGNERSDFGNKVDERVFGAFTAFMGDPDMRGKIFWVLLTARPFELAPDTGRPGRAEEHLPILAPETFEDKQSILEAVARSCDIEIVAENGRRPNRPELEKLFEAMGFVTPAAIELIAHRARRRARRQPIHQDPSQKSADERVHVPLDLFVDEASSYVPEGSAAKLRLQTLEAVLYTNHLSYLPEPWRSRLREDSDGLSRERDALRRTVD
ncbi:MAG: ATP-binding protein [Polyangiaceae bacterium]|nr:ATP-binding protein [Polyangiaceae bacterium]